MADESAVSLAEEFLQRGYVNAMVLQGGALAWHQAGFPIISVA
ncbi:MAG: hypothetical protein WBP29_06145 [Candidatus Zixiibacteriota bacterium]